MVVQGAGDNLSCGDSGDYVHSSATPAGVEYYVQGDITSTGYSNWLMGRVSTTANTFYFVQYNAGGANEWRLYRRVAGTATLLGSYAGDVPTSVRTVKLEIKDATKKVFIGGVERISTTDNTITAAGRPGIGSGQGTIDNYEAGAFTTGYTLTAAQGSFALTGQSSNLLFGRKVTAAQGSFTLSGQALNFVHGYKLTAAQGAFALSGQTANLLFGRRLAASQGAFALNGQTAGLLFGRKLSASAGSFALSGQAANLVYTPAGTYTLTASAGSFSLTGNDASLLYARKMPAAVGTFSLTGFAAGLTQGTSSPVESPTYGGGGGFMPIERKSLRKDVAEDVQAAIAELTYVTKAAVKAVEAKEPEPLRFVPLQTRLTDAMRQALAVVDESLSAIQRTQVQLAVTAARDAQRKLEAQEREAQARDEMNAAIVRAKRRKAAAIAAAYFFGD
jgi:hypothetical protein